MGAGDLELLDLLYDAGQDDEPRLKVGDQASGAGVGQDCAYLATDGFVSMPNGPDAAGGCATAVCWTPGDDRIVIACADGRYNGKAGTLGAGDRAIVSNCDAALLLQRAANKISLLALLQQLSITLDAGTNKITISTPNGGISLNPTGIGLAWLPGGGVNVEVNLTSTSLTLGFSGPGGASGIAMTAEGVAITGTTMTFNGVPFLPASGFWTT
jgi:hypothetical protein